MGGFGFSLDFRGFGSLGSTEFIPGDDAVVVLVLGLHELGGHVLSLLFLEPLLDLFFGEGSTLVLIDGLEKVLLGSSSRGVLGHIHDFNIEVEGSASGNSGTRATCTVTFISGDDEGSLGSLAETNETLIPSLDDLTGSDSEVEGLASTSA